MAGFSRSTLYGRHFSDDALEDILSDQAFVNRMVRFEAALAGVEGRLGVIPAEAGSALETVLAEVAIAPERLAAGVAASGVPVPALVAALREAVPEHGTWLHWGATSQDVVDTAQVLGIRAALDVLGPRLSALIDALAGQSARFSDVVMAGRTRGQVATPITFGLRVAQWAQPLVALENDLIALRMAVLKVQFGGASGANTAVAPNGPAITAGLAEALGLTDAAPWHTDRSGLLALAGWLLRVAVALSKMAGDLVLMMRTEIAEVKAGVSGGSSTMPQKANPVGPEAVLTLGRLVAAGHGALIAGHAEERDGAVWPVEWAVLPEMMIGVGAALCHAQGLAASLAPDTARMRSHVDAVPGIMAEAASFALAAHMQRAEAQAVVKSALAAGSFKDRLAATGVALDWDSVLDPGAVVGPCRAVAEQIFAARQG